METGDRKGEYSIGDVARICNIPAHTIRFWEREFGSYIVAGRTPGKQRRYSEASIQRLLRVRKLLWTDGYSIHGARRILSASAELTISPDGETALRDPHELAMNIVRFIQDQLTITHSSRAAEASRSAA